jgi:hypothetical protein
VSTKYGLSIGSAQCRYNSCGKCINLSIRSLVQRSPSNVCLQTTEMSVCNILIGQFFKTLNYGAAIAVLLNWNATLMKHRIWVFEKPAIFLKKCDRSYHKLKGCSQCARRTHYLSTHRLHYTELGGFHCIEVGLPHAKIFYFEQIEVSDLKVSLSVCNWVTTLECRILLTVLLFFCVWQTALWRLFSSSAWFCCLPCQVRAVSSAFLRRMALHTTCPALNNQYSQDW